MHPRGLKFLCDVFAAWQLGLDLRSETLAATAGLRMLGDITYLVRVNP